MALDGFDQPGFNVAPQGGLPADPGYAMQAQSTAAPKTPQGIGGFLARNAQTIGGITGGIIGGTLGLPANVLDAVSGVGGTAIDLGMATGGAAIGGGIGQEIKNKFDPAEASNPIREGALQGLGELAGNVGGKVVARAAKPLMGAATDIFKNAFNIPAKLAGRLDPEGTASKIMNYGISGGLNKMIGVSQNALGMLDNIYRSSIGKINGTVDTKPVIDEIDRFLKSPTTTELTDADINKIKQLTTLADTSGAPGSSLLKIDPQTAVDRMRALQDAGHTLVAKGTNRLNPNARLEQIGNAYLAAGDKLQNILDDAGGKASVNAFKTPEIIKQLSSISPKLAQEFQNAKTPQEVRTLMSPFVRLKTMARITMESPRKGKLLANMLGAGGGFGLAGVPGAVMGGLVGSPIIEGIERNITAPIATTAGRALNAAGGALGKFAEGPAIPALGLTGEDLVSKTIAALTGGAAEGSPDVANTATTPSSIPGTLPGGQSGSATADLVSSSIKQSIPEQNQNMPVLNLQEYQALLNAVGQRGVESYLAAQRQENPMFTQKQQDDWVNNQNAVQAVQDFAKTFDAIKAKGAVVGPLQELGTKIPGIQNIGSEAALKTYEDNKGDLASTLAQVLGGGRGSKALLMELKSELPDVNDSPAAAAMKLNIIVQRLGANMQTIMSAPSTNVPGIANFSGQTVPGSFPSQLPITPPQLLTAQ